MLTYSFEFDQKAVNDIIEALQNAPRKLQQEASNRVKVAMERAIAPLKVEPPQSPLPFIWSTDPKKQARARRWYFANKVPPGSTGERYKRTHGLAQGWEVDLSQFRNSILIAVSNPAERAVKWTESIFQVPSHQASGWAQYEDVLLKAENEAFDILVDIWYELI